MSEETLDRLGTYYLYHSVQRRYGTPFVTFVKKVQNGTWEAYLA